MNIILTDRAKECLREIFNYHVEYSLGYAQDFQIKLIEFISKNLKEFPKIGHVYNEAQEIYRLIYKGRYNIYYQIEGQNIYVYFIIDGQTQFNATLREEDIDIKTDT